MTVTAADGASVTRYTYQGNQTTVTDPAGKSKTFTTDAMGNLVTVTEPDPILGTDTTTYTYNAANQLLTVTMPRSNGTQTRSFQWTGSDLTSATNPENGTVTYTYDAAHRVKTRIDAKGQKTDDVDGVAGRRGGRRHADAVPVLLRSDGASERHDGNQLPVANRDANGDAGPLHFEPRTDPGDGGVWAGRGDDGIRPGIASGVD